MILGNKQITFPTVILLLWNVCQAFFWLQRKKVFEYICWQCKAILDVIEKSRLNSFKPIFWQDPPLRREMKPLKCNDFEKRQNSWKKAWILTIQQFLAYTLTDSDLAKTWQVHDLLVLFGILKCGLFWVLAVFTW